MNKIKLIVTLAAFLAVNPPNTAAQTSVAYWSAYGPGGCTDTTPGSYAVSVNWKYPSATGARAEKGGVTYKAYAADDGLGCTANGLTGTNLRVVYEVKTSTQIIPTIIASDPPNKMVKYASKGSCGPTLAAKLDSIVVTVTGSNLTVECPALGYKAGGTTNHTIAFSRYR